MPFLADLVLIFALAIVVSVAFSRVSIPPIVGFLLTGTLIGPHALGWVRDVHQVEVLAEIGVVLLLFGIGLEFSLPRLLAIRRLVLWGGGLQVAATGAAAAAVAASAGFGWRSAAFLGMVVALSSTAIALKALADRGELDAPHGRVSLGVLVFQDLCVVPMMLALPFLAGTGGSAQAFAMTLAKAFAVVAGAMIAARKLVPLLLRRIVATRSREIFLLTVILLCLGAAWLTSIAGLSLALGAFIAGLVVSESEYSVQALGEILPFRDALASLFFVSIGMLLDVPLLAAQPLRVGGWAVGILVLKAVLAAGVAMLLGWPRRTALLAGIALAQVGEFSFLLSRSPEGRTLLGAERAQLFLAASVATMALTPLLLRLAPRLADRAHPAGRRPAVGEEPPGAEGPSDHVIICGFGLNGRNLARVLRGTGIHYLVLEINPETVRREAAAGEPIQYGDASREEVLAHAGVAQARLLVVAISDAAATRGIVELARRLNPHLQLVVRTRYVAEVGPLFALGANEVIPEEFETSVEIFSRVLHHYLVPGDRIQACIAEIRREGYGMLRGAPPPVEAAASFERFLGGAALEVVKVEPGSPMDGVTLAGAALRSATGVTVLGVRRGERFEANPSPEFRLQAEDHALVLGDPDLLAAAASRFRLAPPPGREEG